MPPPRAPSLPSAHDGLPTPLRAPPRRAFGTGRPRTSRDQRGRRWRQRPQHGIRDSGAASALGLPCTPPGKCAPRAAWRVFYKGQLIDEWSPASLPCRSRALLDAMSSLPVASRAVPRMESITLDKMCSLECASKAGHIDEGHEEVPIPAIDDDVDDRVGAMIRGIGDGGREIGRELRDRTFAPMPVHDGPCLPRASSPTAGPSASGRPGNDGSCHGMVQGQSGHGCAQPAVDGPGCPIDAGRLPAAPLPALLGQTDASAGPCC